MSEDLLMWIIFFIIMIPGVIIFEILYQKKHKQNRILTFISGFVIGLISMLISIQIVGWL